MASVVISGRGGQLGGATGQTYYCFDCDRTLTIIATSDSGLICPICGHLVLEEFETPSSPPSPPPPPPPRPRSTAVIDRLSFFPTSDTDDSDIELSDPLPPPPPPLSFFITTPTTSTGRETILPDTVDFRRQLQIRPPQPQTPSPPSRSVWDFYCPFDPEVRHLPPPPPPPPPLPPFRSEIGRRSPCPQFPVQSAPAIDNFPLSPPEENDTTQYGHFASELDDVQPPPEQFVQSPPLSPSTSSDWESFFSPPTEPVESTWDYFFPAEPEVNSPNHPWPLELQPPPPPPWLQPSAMEGFLDMNMTKELVSEWECHQCSICIDNFELNQKVKMTPCNHLYHSDCLLRWLDLHKSCPVCRCKLPSQ